ncbi:PREDICTED: LOW QUALITY PROTEIN: serine/threonine-protein kinase tousled-like 2 [Priapulus caudatus]|uniref:LOW QUALITY PROTEIN: serine/threonine-protein kinase tousled-like 2 n=1 Tax=Priapulus caudatus TaxID=37621 RepID=A0ABM1DRM6_PRICU|nr:PREDICTED: LOW QUALITY PROTEIN: serine/threonine-protein kinase tousled-like 2 [Priapulus caudatus]
MMFSSESPTPSWNPTPTSVGSAKVGTFARPLQDVSGTSASEKNVALDPRKQELLEARFLGSRTVSFGQNQDSNMSAASNVSSNGDDKTDSNQQLTPDKMKSPTSVERKRKRKNADREISADGQQPPKGSQTAKKINEYFNYKSGHSPSHSGGPYNQQSKSQSPQNFPPGSHLQPQSPQQDFSGLLAQGTTQKGSLRKKDHMQPQSPLQQQFASFPQLSVSNNMQSSNSNHDYASMGGIPSHLHTRTAHKQIQTDMTMRSLVDLEAQSSTELQQRDTKIEEMMRSNDELKRQLTAQQKLVERQKESLNKCVDMNKTLLIEKVKMEKQAARQKCMANRLRLGQFVTQRQGATFVENWVDGYSFTEIIKQQESIAQHREDIEKMRKQLVKRRQASDAVSSVKQPKTTKKINGPAGNEEFIVPQSLSLKECMTGSDLYEQDEILKLRAATLKKEDMELQMEMEKLERERNLHIRELKRIHNEDQSRFNDNQVLHDRYLLLTLLGKGGFSEVHKAFDLREQRYVACKIHQLNKDWKDDKKANYIKHALREYNIHKSLHHARIVQLHDVFEIDQNSFCTVLEYCDGNDLDFYLKQHKQIPEKEARSIIMQCVSALKYLNEIKPPIIHYDLKPGNILLGAGALAGEVKITDFGLSKIMDPENYDSESGMDLTSQGAGTYWYLPPECFVVGKEPPKISNKVDVWSIGVIFYQCLYGKKPFGHNQSQATILEENTILKATQVEFPAKPPVSSEAKNFIRKCLAYRKEERTDVLDMAVDTYIRPPRRGADKSGDRAVSSRTASPLPCRPAPPA